MDTKPRGQMLCWVYLCDGEPEVLVALPRKFPERHPIVWVCARCAVTLKRAPAPGR